MKRLLLIALIFTAPAFAQEEETENEETQVEIRMESLGGGVEVAAGGSANTTVAAFPDKSIWSVSRDGNTRRVSLYTYCWGDEGNEPHCKEVKPE